MASDFRSKLLEKNKKTGKMKPNIVPDNGLAEILLHEAESEKTVDGNKDNAVNENNESEVAPSVEEVKEEINTSNEPAAPVEPVEKQESVKSVKDVKPVESAKQKKTTTKAKQTKASSKNDTVKEEKPEAIADYLSRPALTAEKCSNEDRLQTTSWNCQVDPELDIRFRYEVQMQDTTIIELINRIIMQERQWEESHPEFPPRDYVMENIRNSKNKKTAGRVSLSLGFLPDSWDYVKKASKRRGMKMNTFVEFLIDAYCAK